MNTLITVSLFVLSSVALGADAQAAMSTTELNGACWTRQTNRAASELKTPSRYCFDRVTVEIPAFSEIGYLTLEGTPSYRRLYLEKVDELSGGRYLTEATLQISANDAGADDGRCGESLGVWVRVRLVVDASGKVLGEPELAGESTYGANVCEDARTTEKLVFTRESRR